MEIKMDGLLRERFEMPLVDQLSEYTGGHTKQE
jgi:hypothetical protein